MPICSMCRNETPEVFGDAPDTIQPRKGLHVMISCGYGMFDDFYGDEPQEKQHIRLCHDCSVKFMALFPPEFQQLFQGGHPCDDDTPCCQYAWRINPETGSTQRSWPDKVWRDSTREEQLAAYNDA